MSRRGTSIETESRLVVDEGWGEWRRLVGREVTAKTYMDFICGDENICLVAKAL